jgi:hypothetical protein
MIRHSRSLTEKTLVLRDYHRAMLVVALTFASSGCLVEQNEARLDLGVDPAIAKWADSAAYRDTIGAYTYPDGMGVLQVRGIGLVVGLGKNGSRQCPRQVRDQLVESLHKRYRFFSGVVGVKGVSPESLIDDIDTAVVIVEAGIPAGARVGTTFDVRVRALPGTQTKSLRGGHLFSTELKTFRTNAAGVLLTGQVFGKADGPVFLNPFADDESATQVSPLEGVVLGGGRATEERKLRLVLLEPSHARAKSIQDRINNRFPDARKIADAPSPTVVEVYVPEELGEDVGHAVGLLRGLYLSHDPVFEATRARLLAREILRPDAPHALITMCLEGLGQSAVAVLSDLYADPREYVRFHAAVAGTRLREHLGVEAISAIAADPVSTYRFQAIDALGEAHGMASAGHQLRALLEDPDSRVRISAYRALLRRNDPMIESAEIGPNNFTLDIVPSSQGRSVYARRTGARRIALIGSGLTCAPPLHYVSPDGAITVNAFSGDEALTLIRVAVGSGARSDPMKVPFDLPPLVRLLGGSAAVGSDGEALGLGIDYGGIVRMLSAFSRNGVIDADFTMEQPNAAELFGPAQPQGRPESNS